MCKINLQIYPHHLAFAKPQLRICNHRDKVNVHELNLCRVARSEYRRELVLFQCCARKSALCVIYMFGYGYTYILICVFGICISVCVCECMRGWPQSAKKLQRDSRNQHHDLLDIRTRGYWVSCTLENTLLLTHTQTLLSSMVQICESDVNSVPLLTPLSRHFASSYY